MQTLDVQQKAAVETTSRRALVLAGAGSGKTKTLIERIAFLIEHQKVSPYECMAFCFTRKAAGELKTRLEERIGKQAYHVHVGTIHALALGMIHRFGDLIGLRKTNVTVYGQWEEDYLLRDVAADMGILKGKTWKIPKKDIDAIFNNYYQQGKEPDMADQRWGLFHAFIQRCKENNSLTYGGLLIGMRLLIDSMAKYLHVKHILVDEVQDIDMLQWQIILEMEKLFGASLYVVGDIDQSIYEWRGAAPKYLVDHQHEFTLYRLETNYRSVPEIVEASNRLIAHNQDRIAKTMKAAREQPTSAPGIIIQKNINSETICDTLSEGDTSMGVVILSRIHGLLEKIDRLMTEKNIPHVYIGKEAALTNSEAFRRFHAFLKLIVNKYDNFSMLLIRDLIGLSREDYADIRLRAAQDGMSHFQAWRNFEDNTAAAEFFDRADEWTFDEMILNLSAGFKWPFELASILKFINEWENNAGPAPTVFSYLDWLAVYDIQDEIKAEEAEGVTLMTIHACKGLEFPVVIVAGCNEGLLPSKQAIAGGDLEAERRLMYVAMTRAKDQLILTVRPEKEEKNGRTYEAPISRFIKEAI
jgi:superfamily I DNA/RNA helicase